ncbi:hypothetical protein jhhlp_002865 [Lomentospora prolificans]|uniref:Ubiquitination network signaling protein n=1 Tax=Lomentospora prolificans TaxID=41688 RepID=A0A2N3NF91_9PEZI|nr:hypothetical protein jhhlp_002865 [Lomentospora prolificans]
MPRGSASGKRQQGASSNSTKHDNGLVAPGKKASRNRNHAHSDGKTRPANLSNSSTTASAASSSQSSLNLPANGSANGSATPPIAANGRTNGHAIPNGNHNGFAKLPADDMVAENSRAHHLARRASLDTESETSTSTDSFHSHHHVANHSNAAAEHPQIDVNASKHGADVHKDSGPLDFAATVLMALPLHDTLAILLILMHVSPLTLSVIYTVFTVLTFASPLTASSVVNIHLAELLDWHSTMPSLVTVLCVDILALLVFLFLWPSVQNAILDLAKPVIAATLGGGSTSRGGQSRTVSACFAFVLSTHVFKNTRSHWTRFLRVLPPSWRFTPDPDDPLEEVSRTAVSAMRHPDPYFTLLGVHILMQGIVRYIREWYIRRERSSAAANASAGDPEAGKPTSAESDAAHQALEAEPTPVTNSTHSSTKRRRKQSAQVRLQQPLWAALASTKVVMVKEYELSHATSESACADATDIHNLGNAPFDRETGRIWISYVGCDEVSFDTSHFPDDFSESESSPSYGEMHSASTAIDRSKPFYVRINNAHWPSTRIVPAQDNAEEADDDAGDGTRWTGDIYGLRPTSKYVCEFVDTHSHAILFSTTVTTTRETRTAAVVNGVPNGQRRPHSPATTLKTSIAASDAKLAAERAKLKTLRKEWKAKVNSLKKDNEGTDNSINSAGGTDDRYRQKIRQQETQKAQAEKEASELDAELKAFDDEPSDVVARRKQVEKVWSEEKSVFEKAQQEFKSHSSAVSTAVKSKEGDKQQLQTRRNKIANRVAKVDNELANIADANKRGLNEVERRKAEREAWQKQVSATEERLNSDFNSVQMDNSMLQEEHANAMQTANTLYAQIYAASTPAATYEMPDQRQNLPSPNQYPPMWNAGTTMSPSAPGLNAPYPIWPAATDASIAPISAPVLNNSWTFPGAVSAGPSGGKTRGRSSSMLSDISGFTQLSNEDETAATGNGFRQSQKGFVAGIPSSFYARTRKPSVGAASGKSSIGSGSGSGTGSWSSARDPSSPS